MNTYKISFQRENNTVLSDRVTAATPGEAKKLFRDIYRHAEGIQEKELKVELVAENTPATKDQEREALEKIKAIVEALGPDSYIGIALDGCFEIAERNIENDFACSMKQSLLHYSEENDKLRAQVKELEEKLHQEIGEHQDVLTQLRIARGDIENLREALAESEKDYEAAHEAAHLVADEKDAEIASLKAQVSSLAETGRWNAERCDEVRSEAWDLQKRAEKAEAEVIRLKAKLYDYMTAGA